MADVEPVNILMVDDQPANLLALEALLRARPYNLVRAYSGREALRHLLDKDFALILMDVLMPEMDGFETVALIRERERSRYTPIIFLTAIGTSETHMSRGYSVGAVDYIFKPVVPEVLKSKVAAFVDLFRKTEEVKRQAQQLREMERREHERKLTDMKTRWEADRLRQEIRVAREIQQKLFPARAPACPGFDIHGSSQPADATGGDYFDYMPIAERNVGIVIGDVTGHGVGPALLMAATRAYLRALALTHDHVGQILTLANRALAADTAEDRFVTLLLARLDPARRFLVYANAGHPSGYVLARDGSLRAALESTSVPLGLERDGVFAAAPGIVLEPGDIVFLLTDGVVEAAGPNDEVFGTERALDVIRTHRHRSAQEIIAQLYNELRRFSGDRPPLDDITAVIVKLNDSGA